MDLVITQLIKKILLPPGGILILFAIAMLLYSLRRKAAKSFFLAGFFSLTLLSLPLIEDQLLRSLEIYPALNTKDITNNDRQAIVVLGGGAEHIADEYNGETVSKHTLLRLRYAAHLHQRSHLPIITTGGIPADNKLSEGFLMAEVLRQEYGVTLVWTEEKSRNTAENAIFTAGLLSELQINKIYLVTQAWHMRRSVMVFEKAGIDVIPAPTAFEGQSFHWTLDKFLPSATAFSNSVNALHEIIGYLWYLIRY